MKFKRVWRGEFPKYWDVTRWAILLEQYVVVCRRNEHTNRRVIERIKIDSGETVAFQTIYNCILGWRDSVIFLARVSDARSHLKVDRIGSFDVSCMSFRWELSEATLIEKYKLPTITDYSGDLYILGSKKIDLNNGHFSVHRQTINYRWPVDEHLSLVQKNDVLACVVKEGASLWEHQGYFGNYFHGVIGEQLFFFMPQNKLVILNKRTGQEIDEIDLAQIRSTTRRVLGDFDLCNEYSFENSTVADCLVGESAVAWIDDTNALKVANRATNTIQSYLNSHSSLLYLSQIKKKNLLMYELENEDYGSLVIGTMEE